MNKIQRLPIGISSFEIIREYGHVYVDKTRPIFRMIDEGMFYFISRPRRFGKSLLVSVLNCLFQGKKEMFEGLWIRDHSNWTWKAHPVILLDFNEISLDTPDHLKEGLISVLNQIGELQGLAPKETLLKERFKELILSLHRKTGEQVVILMDEYDKPLVNHLGKGEKRIKIAEANRDILKSFFGVIKGGEVSSALRFVFITGISKFSRISLFSELNNLNDITMNRKYADMLGYTQEEVETCFAGHIEQFAQETGGTPKRIRESLRRHYDGYRFSEKDIRVYNPFSVLRSLEEKTFKNYWFETGTPSFLVNILRERNYDPPKIENWRLDETSFSSYDIDRLEPEALLFQTGYITIREVENRIYTFRYPNQEVKISFLKHLLFS